MALFLYPAAESSVLDGFKAFMELGSGTATLVVKQGERALVSFNLNATPFASAQGDALVLNAASSGTATASGRATRGTFINQNGDPGLSFTIGLRGTGADLELDEVEVTEGAVEYVNALVLGVASTGDFFLEGSLSLL